MKKSTIILAVIATLVVAVLAFPIPLIGSLGHFLFVAMLQPRPDPARPVYSDLGYYRIIAETRVGDEPLELNVVVRCVLQKLPGRTRELRIPYLYGLRTKGGSAVIMYLPELCSSIEKVGLPPKHFEHFPTEFLPLMLWAENADDLEEFTAYTAEVAYTHKNARMTRPKVRSATASAADHAAWQKTHARKNVLLAVPPEPFGSDHEKYPTLWPAGVPKTLSNLSPVDCTGMIRLPLAPERHASACPTAEA